MFCRPERARFPAKCTIMAVNVSFRNTEQNVKGRKCAEMVFETLLSLLIEIIYEIKTAEDNDMSEEGEAEDSPHCEKSEKGRCQ